ncbi:MAG: ATP-binding protein [Hyphomicrobiales bacterium]|nr:ATP-binding protein [Hyphomicrobiales bacterium]MCP5371525.1 ATP-binding protein [Hyphomicrobiales bacterium]
MVEHGKTIGAVIMVDGARAIAELDPAAAASGSDLAVGDLVKMPGKLNTVYGLVHGIKAVAGAGNGERHQQVDIDFLGEVFGGPDAPFQRGVSRYPSIGAPLIAADRADALHVYARPSAPHVRIGKVHQGADLDAFLLTDDLLSKHFAVLGTTGSGKSCTVTLILRSLLHEYPDAHVLLLDPHNEYADAFGDIAKLVSLESLTLPYWLMNSEELVETIVRTEGDDREDQIGILRNAVLRARREFTRNAELSSFITVDTPSPFSLTDLIKIIDAESGKLERAESVQAYMRLIERLERLRADRRFAFMFSTKMAFDNLDEILGFLLRIPVEGKPMTVVDLSGIPSEIIDVVVSILSRMIFDFALWNPRSDDVPLLLVCEEAHRYIPRDDEPAFMPTKNALARIAKEGRKHGVSLCLVSQRPSDLSQRILSQCGTIFGLRMSNDTDQEFVQRALPESARSLMRALPALRTQEAIVIGDGTTVPARIMFDDLPPEHQPRSKSARYSSAWKADSSSADMIKQTVARWRFQRRRRPQGS